MKITCEPKVVDSDRYTPTEVTALLGISRSSLWRYSQSGLIMKQVGMTGIVYYFGRDIKKLWHRLLL